jgi:hypothetical protein
MSDSFELPKIIMELNARLTAIEDNMQYIIGFEKNNLDRIYSNVLLASRIFGEQTTLQQCLEEITKLKELGMTEIE